VTALLAALAAAAVLGGLLLVAAGLRPVPAAELAGRPPSVRARRLRAALTGTLVDGPGARRRRTQLVLALAGGMLAFAFTGLALMVLAIPVAVLGLPKLLGTPASAADTARLEALEEWTRNLAGVLAVGVSLEQAISASLRSTPEPIRPQVENLVARLATRWQTDAALRAFADELDDATGDLVAASLILSAKRRGAGLVSVLDGLAASVAEDVRTRRQIEADRAKPRSTARAVTFITLAVLALLALNRTYVEPYTSPLGQALLIVLLSGYVATLLWMRQMTAGKPTPRFLTATPALSTAPGSAPGSPVEAVVPLQAVQPTTTPRPFR
jgi:Flp pilus assembly protein TadB